MSVSNRCTEVPKHASVQRTSCLTKNANLMWLLRATFAFFLLSGSAVLGDSNCKYVDKPKKTVERCSMRYYIAARGNDSKNGLTKATAWKTFSHVNSMRLSPGTCIYLKGGDTITGTLQLDSDDAGNARSPVVIGSYGAGRAAIYSGTQTGVSGTNVAGVIIQDLKIVGSGADSFGSGVSFIKIGRAHV